MNESNAKVSTEAPRTPSGGEAATESGRRAARISRRRWLAAVPAVVPAAAVVPSLACGRVVAPPNPGPAAAPRQASPYLVRVQVWGTLQDHEIYDKIAADYNLAHADIKMETDHHQAGAGGTGYYETLTANLAAGTAADLVYFQQGMWQEYATNGTLQPLDELAARDKWRAPWPGEEAYDLQTRFRGKRYLSPSHAGAMVMYYVKEYFDRAGLSYPKADWTYAEFQDLCRKLTRTVDGRQVYGYQWNGSYLGNAPWWRMNNHLEWDRIAEPKKAFWNAGAVLDACQFQLYDSQYRLQISPTQALLSADPHHHRLESGGVAMKMDGPGLLPRLWGAQAKRQGGTPFDVQVLPRGKSARTPHVTLIEGQAMTRQSKDKDAAWDVMKWIGGEDGQKRVAEGGRMCNVPEVARKFWLPLAKAKYNVANAEAFVKAMEAGTIHIVGEVAESVLNRDAGLSQALDDIRDGKATAKEALDQVQPKIQQLLDTYWAGQPGGGK